jgi:uncharacterized membrane protein
MNQLFLPLRIIHVLFAAAWLGGAVFTAFFLMPAMQDAGPDAGKVMMALMRRKLPAYIASVAGLTVVTGLYLYWHLTSGFDPALSGSLAGRVFGTGGLLGIVAFILAASIVSRSMKGAVKLMVQAGSTADAKERGALMERAAALRARARTFASIVAVLLIFAIMFMAAGHYV